MQIMRETIVKCVVFDRGILLFHFFSVFGLSTVALVYLLYYVMV